MNKPETIATTKKEGGEWEPFRKWSGPNLTIHSIKFADGSVWDAYNGWREPNDPPR